MHQFSTLLASIINSAKSDVRQYEITDALFYSHIRSSQLCASTISQYTSRWLADEPCGFSTLKPYYRYHPDQLDKDIVEHLVPLLNLTIQKKNCITLYDLNINTVDELIKEMKSSLDL